MPDHPHEHDQVFTNPNEACERYQYIPLPLQPAKVKTLRNIISSQSHATQGSSKERTGMGSIGTAVTGAAFFNDWSDPNGKVAMSFEVSCTLCSKNTLTALYKNVDTDRNIFMKIAG